MELQGEQGKKLRREEDSMGSNRRENRIKRFRLIPVT